MDKSEITSFLWMMGGYGVAIIGMQYATGTVAIIIAFSGIGLSIAGMVVQEKFVEILLGKYHHLVGIVPGEKELQHIYYLPKPVSKPLGHLRYFTLLKMPFKLPYHHKVYGKVYQIGIFHNLPWSIRIKALAGFAQHFGMTVEHSKTDYVIIREREVPSWDKAKLFPYYELVVTNTGDFPEEGETPIVNIIQRYYTRHPELEEQVAPMPLLENVS